MSDDTIIIRKARIDDVERIHAMISAYARGQLMLARSRSELYESLRDFVVAETGDGRVVGCGGLEICWKDLAEVRSLAVEAEFKGRGLGRQITEACLQEAVSLGIPRVFALTYQVPFFEKLGFRQISKEELPHKIWSHCLNCPKFPDCDEVAVACDLKMEG